MTINQRNAVRDMLTRGGGGAQPRPVEELRKGFAEMMSTFPVPSGVTLTDTTIAGRPAVLVEPRENPRPGTMLYFHGGSFALGSPSTAMSLTAHLVLRTGIRALSVDYRLAPENPYPAGVTDCFNAYQALLNQGVAPQEATILGDSAGGGLSVTTVLAAKNAGLPVPSCVVCFSPGLDQRRSGGSFESKRGIDPFFTPEALIASGERYLAGSDPHTEMTSPAVYADMKGFPPLLLQVGSDELLLDDSVRFAERARDAEVDVILDVTAKVPHVFQAFVDHLDEAGDALDRAALFIRQHVGRSATE
ncbi:alpha/beta hydrolase [Kocuria massiliensis]|uniref:alpha/beta hydrolase n=1 Tax=Kocuria massiliensis TaxID=1926282 RepID=UPI0022B9AB11|nr:alpha/beta hydrolase [Kocuria massiliensis]